MISGFVLSIAMTAVMVPPGEEVVDHSQPWHYAQPTIQRFERQADDDDRRAAWESYNLELEELWNKYREAGSTPRAWKEYNQAARDAKRHYAYNDAYLAAVSP